MITAHPADVATVKASSSATEITTLRLHFYSVHSGVGRILLGGCSVAGVARHHAFERH